MTIQKTFFSSFDADPFPMQHWYLQHMAQIAGIDEAGRGPLAGPVVAAAVVLSEQTSFLSELNDSKKLTEKKRDILFDKIHEEAMSIGISIVGIEEIDERNILGATLWGMKEAFYAAQNKATTPILGALIDGNQRAPLKEDIVQHTLVGGDAKYGILIHGGFGPKTKVAHGKPIVDRKEGVRRREILPLPQLISF